MLGVFLQKKINRLQDYETPVLQAARNISSIQPKPFQNQHALSDSVVQREGTGSDQLTVLNLNFKEPSMAADRNERRIMAVRTIVTLARTFDRHTVTR